MATAAVKRERPKPAPLPPVQEVTVVMSAREAETLLIVLNKVGGDPQGRRADIDSIRVAINQAGLKVDHQVSVEAAERGSTITLK